jgi:hypothetical protein
MIRSESFLERSLNASFEVEGGNADGLIGDAKSKEFGRFARSNLANGLACLTNEAIS